MIILFSLTDRLTSIKLTLIWPTESLGFVWGIILADNLQNIKKWMSVKWKYKLCALFVLGVTTGVLYLKFKNTGILGDYLLKIFLGIVLITLILHITRKFEIGNRALRLLGDVSYEVYLLHGFVMNAVVAVCPELESGLYILIVILLTVALAFAVKKVSSGIMRISPN